jgi:hypothetical protein
MFVIGFVLHNLSFFNPSFLAQKCVSPCFWPNNGGEIGFVLGSFWVCFCAFRHITSISVSLLCTCHTAQLCQSPFFTLFLPRRAQRTQRKQFHHEVHEEHEGAFIHILKNWLLPRYDLRGLLTCLDRAWSNRIIPWIFWDSRKKLNNHLTFLENTVRSC